MYSASSFPQTSPWKSAKPFGNEMDSLTEVIICGVPEVAPRGYRILESPSTRSGDDTIFDLECITEL
jgi:hypothetical protein